MDNPTCAMGAAEKDLKDFLDLMCDRSLEQTYAEYYKFTRDLVGLFMSDNNSAAEIVGSGYNSLPVLRESQDFGDRHFLLRTPPSRDRIYLVQHVCSVLENRANEYVADRPVLLYASSADTYDSGYPKDEIVLHLSSRTYSLVHREDYGIPLKESIVVRLDSKRIPKFHLSSKRFMSLFNKSHERRFLLFGVPPVPLDLRSIHVPNVCVNSEAEQSDDTELWYEAQKPTVNSMSILPAFKYSGWPTVAHDWGTRARAWPTNALVREVLASQIYVVPIINKDVKINSDLGGGQSEDNLGCSDDLLWRLEFSIAEQLLFSKLGAEVKKVFYLLQTLTSDSPDSYSLMTSVFLWSLEEHGAELGAAAESTAAKLMKVLSKLETFLERENIPHYFIPETNILGDEIDRRRGLVQLTKMMSSDPVNVIFRATGFDALHNLLNDLNDNGNKSHRVKVLFHEHAQKSLLDVIKQNTRLLCIQLYQKLHTFNQVTENIAIHHSLLSRFTETDVEQSQCNLLRILRDFVHSSLGNLYLVRGLQAYFAKEKAVFFDMSKEQFSLVTDQENAVAKIRSSSIFSKRSQHQHTVDILKPTLQTLLKGRTPGHLEIPKVQTNPKGPFTSTLFGVVTEALKSIDLLVMKQEKQAFPKAITKNLGLAYFQLLGCTKQPVAVLDSTIVCGYLLAQAYNGLGLYQDAKETLQKVEDFCLKDEVDLNEKRGCVYLNVIADAYINAKDVEQGKYLLQRSLAIMPNPRNPGRWTLMSVTTKKAREYVIGGMGVAIATAVTAVAINFLLNKK